jgi:antitoxin CcdA
VTKRSANLSVDAELLDKARALNVNLSQALDRELRRIVREAEAAAWLEENREAIEAYNRRVDEQGILSDEAGVL